MYSQPDGATSWERHATGVLGPDEPKQPEFDAAAWPPAGAEPLDLNGFYADLADSGHGYGPAFQGLTAAYQLGDEVFVEAVFPGDGEDRVTECAAYGLHPALFD
ncbi:polyketide synthase dehydratase domain-containing protein, partial [Amycolatopsis sp. SID8362]|uniref:polyketide synthase dehydratase domain-containing protein n=1 Tax=Amycolatopsis sp. SID8362 TaxID=2690346 RepID=UPI002814A485